MIGGRVESRSRLPWGSLLFFAIGLALLAYAWVVGQESFAIASALPIAIGLSTWLFGRERGFAAEFAEDSIEVDDPPASIPYADLRHVQAGGLSHDPTTFRRSTLPIYVEHQGGVFTIPARLNVPSHEVYRFLAGQVPPNGDRDVNPSLVEYLERQESYFGPEHVWTYRAAARKAWGGRYRGLRSFGFGLMLAGATWAAIGFGSLPEEPWGVAGIFCGLLGICFYLVTLAGFNNRFIKRWKDASLVIGPQGMAMVQGDVQGEVRWPELLEVRFRPKPPAIGFHYTQGLIGIMLRVKGADILIADIYDRPLYVIHERILASSGQSGPEEVEL